MEVKPILFNTEMIRAILDDRKTVTRRVIKPQPIYNEHDGFEWRGNAYGLSLPPTLKGAAYNFRCACHCQTGDILYVRETWNTNPLHEYGNEPNKYVYKADYDGHAGDFGWKPSIHMPKEAVRIWLKVTDVRVERLQDMGRTDFLKEGLTLPHDEHTDLFLEMEFKHIWDSTQKKKAISLYGWDANPLVWTIEFERVKKPKGE